MLMKYFNVLKEISFCRPKAAITHMCAANNILILAMAGNNFLRISIDQKQTTEG